MLCCLSNFTTLTLGMTSIYQRSKAKASLSQILFVAHLITTMPVIYLGIITVNAIEREASAHARYLESGNSVEQWQKPSTLLTFGAFLRKNSFPFTNFESQYRQTNQSRLVENLRDVQVAVLYGLVLLATFGCIAYGLLTFIIYRAFRRLFAAVAHLSKDKKSEQIQVFGPGDIRDLSADLESLRVKIQGDKELQQQHLRHISHELKTPLASISEGSRLLDEEVLGEINQEQQEITKILVKSSGELQTAIQNLLDYNEAVAVTDKKHREPVRLSELLTHALDKHELAIRSRALTVATDTDDSESMVDPNQILAVFENLISNAIKNSPDASTINLILKQDDRGKVSFIIEDQGKGVQRGQEKAIFAPFFVGERTKKMPLRGTGLGLSIAKQYLDEHNGDIRLLKSNRGAAFHVTLPAIGSSN